LAKLNGQPLNRAWITHDEIARGGSLEFEMGILANKNWGVRAE
jgi:putative alpha-1,2-mannosidase